MHAACVGQIEWLCRQAAATKEKVQVDGDAGVTSSRVRLPASADATAAGRACIAERRKQCAREAQQRRQRSEQFARIDAQLEPGRVDRAFTDAVAERVRAALGLGAADVVVECTAQLCRMTTPGGLLDAGRVDDRVLFTQMSTVEQQRGDPPMGHEVTSHAGAVYATRGGYRLPH